MKDKILNALRENKNEYISGEDLSDQLGVSRTSIWKCIKGLKDLGYNIQSSSKKGYRLEDSQDILNEHELKFNLRTNIMGKNIEYFEKIDSTNKYAKKIAYEGCSEGTLVVANSQNLGRGRLGRSWESTPDKGIWMSLVLRPLLAPQDVHIITLAASVAVVNAIKKATGIDTGIKWPNDIILDNRKVCGILTEMSAEIDRVNFIVLGIGINTNQNQEDFDSSLSDKATSLKLNLPQSKTLNRSNIIKILLEEIERIYILIKEGKIQEVISLWKEHSVTIGKEVRIVHNETEFIGKAVDVLSDGRLIIEDKNGDKKEILSGEISVRGLLGYI